MFLIEKPEHFTNFMNDLKTSYVAFLDTETTDKDVFIAKPLLLQVMLNNNIYIFNLIKLGKYYFKYIVELLDAKGIKIVMHNAKFDIKIILNNTGVWLKNVHDTMWVENIINAGLVPNKFISFKELVEKYCGVTLDKEIREEFINFDENTAFTQEQLTYSANDVFYLKEVYEKQLDLIYKSKQDRVMDVENKAVAVVALMEFNGILLDIDSWRKMYQDSEKESKFYREQFVKMIIDKATEKSKNCLDLAEILDIPVKKKHEKIMLESIKDSNYLRSWAFANFNPGSNQQVKSGLSLFYPALDNTNEKYLKKLDKTPEFEELLSFLFKFRELDKEISTYGENIINKIHPVTNRLHTEYMNIGADTGRMSSINPNLQNIPSKDGFRNSFISKPGYSIIAMDYSQQEFRLVGAVSQEDKIIDAYIAGLDMHTATGAVLYHKDIKDVTKEERTRGKTVNFAIVYGSTEFGLAYNLGISVDEAREIIRKFYAGYPKLAAFKDVVGSKILELGYSVTPLGRRRYFKPEPVFGTMYDIKKYRNQIIKEGFNHIFQGGGADITKIALANIGLKNPFGDKFNLLLQVHDELVAEVSDDIIDDAIQFMKTEMIAAEQPFLGRIPAVVDYKVGKFWQK